MVVSEVVDKVRSRGYWDVAIRPETYQDERVPYAELDEIVRAAEVRMRGWPVPYFDPREQPLRGANWIGQDVDATVVAHYEAWRFHTSGQFNHLRAIDADWRHTSEISPTPASDEKVIQVWEVLFYLTEIFEFAARLALGPSGDETMVVDVGLHGLAGRGLIVGQRNRAEFFQPYRTNETSLQQGVTATRQELIAKPRELAVDMAIEFFVRFGWKPSRDQLAEHQRELTDRV